VGGLDLGLHKAGFDIKFFNDFDEHCVKSLQINWPDVPVFPNNIDDLTSKEILDISGLQKGEVDLISGGPPCQPYSKSGFWLKDRWEKGENNRKYIGYQNNKDSNIPIKKYIQFINELKPKAFFFENVHGIAYSTSRPLLNIILSELKRAGYKLSYKVVNAVDYGIPQKRKRFIMIGLNGESFKFPKPTHCEQGTLDIHTGRKQTYVTAGDAIKELDDGTVRESERVGGKWGHLLPEIPPGDNYLYYTEKRGHPNPVFKWRSKYWNFLLKLSPSLPSWTIQANPGPYVGPFHWNNRRLRIPEIKRLQSFPDEYQVSGNRKIQWRQVGDAVPPLLSQKIGEALIDQIFS